MGIQYRVKKTKMNYKEGKPEGYQVQAVNHRIITEDNLVEYIANSAHVPRSMVLACTMAIADAITFYVINGHRVEFKNIGKFHLKVQNTCVDTLEECQADTVKRTQLCFTPNADVKDLLAKIKLTNLKALSEMDTEENNI